MDRFRSFLGKLSVAAASGLMAASASAVTIRNVPSCGVWSEDRPKQGMSSVANELWLLGFLSGLATATDGDFIRGTDNPSLFLWMDNYCRANPLMNIGDGGSRLFQELAKQKRK